MAQKVPQSTTPGREEKDPVFRALDDAPADDAPESDERRAEIERRKANPEFVSGAAVSAKLADRRRRNGG
jgi:hypothetical protein